MIQSLPPKFAVARLLLDRGDYLCNFTSCRRHFIQLTSHEGGGPTSRERGPGRGREAPMATHRGLRGAPTFRDYASNFFIFT